MSGDCVGFAFRFFELFFMGFIDSGFVFDLLRQIPILICIGCGVCLGQIEELLLLNVRRLQCF